MSNVPKLRSCQRVVCVLLFLILPAQAFGQAYKATIGYDKLKSEVGAGLANGAGVVVALAEANTGAGGTNTYYLNTADSQFSGKSFTDISNLTPRNISGHATSVGQLFFGNTSSIAGGVTNVQVYDAEKLRFRSAAVGERRGKPKFDFRVFRFEPFVHREWFAPGRCCRVECSIGLHDKLEIISRRLSRLAMEDHCRKFTASPTTRS